MPKICRKFFQIESEHVPVDIFYNQTKQFFAVGIPEGVVRCSQPHLSHFETEQKLYDSIKAAVSVYHEKIKKSKKVIAYSLEMTTNVSMNATGRGSWEGYKDWVPDTLKTRPNRIFDDSGDYGFAIGWDVLFEVKAKETTYHSINEDGSIGYQTQRGERQLIDWTPEREEAFREIAAALVDMVKKISGVLGSTRKMIAMMDGGFKLLPYLTDGCLTDGCEWNEDVDK